MLLLLLNMHNVKPKLEKKRMELLYVVYGHRHLAFVLFLLGNLAIQGQALPRFTSNAEEVSGKSFDYIVVGGGTAGCPLAATLSERFSVLVIERGSSPYGNPLVSDKLHYGFALLETDEFSSAAQMFISKDGVTNHRGRVLGGSSAINGGFYSRASDDFVKSAGWDDELVQESYEWVESKVVFKPALTMWQTIIQFGLLEAGILPYNGFSWKHIKGTKIGGTMFDEWGKRSTSADLLKTWSSGNITVLLNATVQNIVFDDNDEDNSTVVHGIRFVKSEGGANHTYEAYLSGTENSTSQGDVILSAGALGSPQLLLLSGIGPSEHLQEFDIPIVLDLKAVGKNMKDNPGIAMLVDSKPEYRYPDTPQVAGITNGFKFIIEGGILPTSPNETRIPIAIKLAFPESKGKLELNSTDPRQNPCVEFNYLEKERDLEECVRMAELLGRVARSESITLFLGTQPQNKLISSDSELKDFCKKNVRTFYHFHGGCTVGSVVDSNYKVIGVKGLRVVDGSTFLESPGTNPMATLMMLGRYQGIKMLREREKSY